MPPSWHAGSWLLYFLIQVNYLTMFAFNLALGNPSTRDDDLITISCCAGEMSFRCVGPDSYTLSLRLVGGESAFNLTVVLRTTPLEPQERPTSAAESIEEYAPSATSIPPLPVHTPSDLWIVPPGVPFQVPCPHCQSPLETGEICQNQFGEGITLICQGPEVPLEEHHRVPFLFLQSSCRQPNFLVESDSTWATRASSPTSSDMLSPDLPSIPISQHARYRAPDSCVPTNVPAGELRVREGTVTPKTVTITNLNTAREARCNHMWESRLALVGSNIVVTLRGGGDMTIPKQQLHCNSFFTFSGVGGFLVKLNDICHCLVIQTKVHIKTLCLSFKKFTHIATMVM